MLVQCWAAESQPHRNNYCRMQYQFVLSELRPHQHSNRLPKPGTGDGHLLERYSRLNPELGFTCRNRSYVPCDMLKVHLRQETIPGKFRLPNCINNDVERVQHSRVISESTNAHIGLLRNGPRAFGMLGSAKRWNLSSVTSV
jgi:hypothetical protein